MNQMQKEMKAVISKYTVGLSNADYTHFMKEIAVVTERHAPKPKVIILRTCPNSGCGDSGGVPHEYAPGEWEQEQCEFCEVETDSVFNHNKHNAEDTEKSNMVIGDLY